MSYSVTDMQAEIDSLKRQLEQAQTKSISWKVSTKGALSIYGLQRMPVTLYKNQWKKIFEQAEAIQAYIEEHDGELSELKKE